MQKEDFVGGDFLTLMDHTAEEIAFILDAAADRGGMPCLA